tara:strand:- start:185 stop:316 length:132 start_codon:yes stop_codon:yes gene_type:complete
VTIIFNKQQEVKMDKKVVSENVIKKLEKGKKEVLKRIAKSLKE